MKGFIYRLGVRVKDFGERIGCGCIVRLGLTIKDRA